MVLIKVDATDSTNLHLKSLLLNATLADYTVVSAAQQLKGRGQRGAEWQSDPYKNLTFSVLKKHTGLTVKKSFVLNIVVSLSIYNVLHELNIPDLSIKWPNDIMSDTSKIAGILIENTFQGTSISSSILGIGLNINQLIFKGLDSASSLKKITGITYNCDGVLHRVVEQLKYNFKRLAEGRGEALWKAYISVLFKKDTISNFTDTRQNVFKGCIKGVAKDGKLLITLEDSSQKSFDFKELKLHY